MVAVQISFSIVIATFPFDSIRFWPNSMKFHEIQSNCTKWDGIWQQPITAAIYLASNGAHRKTANFHESRLIFHFLRQLALIWR